MRESEINPLFADCVHRPSNLPSRDTRVVIQIVKGVNTKPQLKLRRGILMKERRLISQCSKQLSTEGMILSEIEIFVSVLSYYSI